MDQVGTNVGSPPPVDPAPTEPSRVTPPAGPLVRLLPLAVFLLLGGLSVVVFIMLRAGEERKSRLITEGHLAQFATIITQRIADQLTALRRLADQCDSGQIASEKAFVMASEELQHQFPGVRLVGLVGTGNSCLWVHGPTGAADLPGKDLSSDPAWGGLVRRCRATALETADPVQVEAGQPVVRVALPTAGRTGGILLVKTTLAPAAVLLGQPVVAQRYAPELSDGERSIVASADTASPRVNRGIPLVDRTLKLSLRISPASGFGSMTYAPQWILLEGLGGAVAASAATWFAVRYRRRQLEHTARYLAALESLNRISTSISAKLSSGEQILHDLTAAGIELLRMDRAGIVMLNAARKTLDLVAFAGHRPPDSRDSFSIGQMPASQRVIQAGEILFIEDIARIKAPFNEAVAREFDAGSIILIPLLVESQFMGMMALSTTRPRQLTALDRRLARLIGSQATVALANSLLYRRTTEALQQAQRDARHRAMLLAELNHRVKNSLSGIVGLLDLDRPDMSPAVRQWVDRAVDRIRMMASAHELFSSGQDHVPLAHLIDHVLLSLGALRREDVSIRADVHADGVLLDTRQAVTLAMALHELCVNAVIYGCAGGGEVVLRARPTGTQCLAVDVLDSGPGIDESVMARVNSGEGLSVTQVMPGARGVGLRLVGELAGRELRGTLRLCRRSEGGTIATIEFAPAPAGALGVKS